MNDAISINAKHFLWQKPSGHIAAEKIKTLGARLQQIANQPGIKKIANSLSAEDMVILHHWVAVATLSGADFFMLETGRLPTETHDYLTRVEQKYNLTIEKILPTRDEVDKMIADHGLNGFYDSLAARKACCGVRKVAPLRRALDGAALWVTGQRQGQGVTRDSIPFQELDTSFHLQKYNPLFDWSEGEVFAYLAQHDVPLHPLYDRGYASIGCDPCSRAIKATEDVRAGRWWWEDAANKECGINEVNLQR
ncbi:MAG: phosphoadenylyl-sulfate reductase [Hydrotalea sp.]|nr:phosphoadenylyl-sulfate reductase [Hydrotalea sp.]